MNILYINSNYNGGGAEKITRQLYFGMKKYGVNTSMVVGCGKDIGDDNIIVINESTLSNKISPIVGVLSNNQRISCKKARQIIFDIIEQKNIDIVHINNIHGNYVGIDDIAYISTKCKVIWTLHDMWIVTGHCAHAFDCRLWKTRECYKCNKKRTYPAFYFNDIRRKYNKKKEAFTNHNITYVTPSHWLEDICRQSYLKEENIVTINNGVDIVQFKQLDRVAIRKKYNIDENDNTILFVAADVHNEYKGFSYMLEALNYIKEKSKYHLLVIGARFDRTQVCVEYKVTEFGYVSRQDEMNEIYSLADIFVIPSIADTFPCVALESLASGTPIVAFATGGIPEIVGGDTGWIVERGNSKKLGTVIDNVFNDKNKLQTMRANCYNRVKTMYTEQLMLERYHQLYDKLADIRK